MAMSLNRAQVIGNLTRDPEIRQTQGGKTVASFGVATNFSWTDQSGQRQDKVEFHNIVAWGKLADICGQYLKKGGKVYVEGRLQTHDWQGEDGVKRYRTEIIADNVIMLDRKGASTEGYSSQPREVSLSREAKGLDQITENAPLAKSEEEVAIDDLPF
ncbi:single-stranded DNA-binding protein [Candidatus Peregrinibacteria bacterium]|nr:single-stranded DNA-binding protein [Candidatus Peregrinibacteria bacterium]